jgi:hypothetical protein
MVASRKSHQFSPYRLNSFQLGGLSNLDAGYRLIRFRGLLEEDDDYEKKVRLLANLLASDLKLPVEPVRTEGGPFLAVAGARDRVQAVSVQDHVLLNPDPVTLELVDGLHPLPFRAGNGYVSKIARRVLVSAIERALTSRNSQWWQYGRRFINRSHNEAVSTERIRVYPAFYYGLIPGSDGTFELVVDPSVCYVDRESLFQQFGYDIPVSIKGKRYLYTFGKEWYKIDALGVGGPANKEPMPDPDANALTNVYDWAVKRWGREEPQLIGSLDPDAPTVAYKTMGQKSRRALSDLLYGLPGVGGDQDGEESPHNEAIIDPAPRAERTEEIVATIADGLKLFGKRLTPSQRLRVLTVGHVEVFPPPSLRFAGDQEVRTNLQTAGRDRFDALRGLGPADSSPFQDEHLVIQPRSMPEDVRKDFKRRFCRQIQELYDNQFEPEQTKYNDEGVRRLRLQARAIDEVLADRRGYALLVLPPEGDRSQQTKLHHYLKRRYWSTVKTQCASAKKILTFYRKVDEGETTRWIVRGTKNREYQSYIRYLALGYLLVNNKCLWRLAEGTLRNDVHVGIDVYKGIAVFTFVYGDADLITFTTSKSMRPEKLSADQIRDELVQNLGPDLMELKMDPASIVFHRDGKLYETEWRGIMGAVSMLQGQQLNVLSKDVKVGVAEIHKTSATRPRIYRRSYGEFTNPEMGTCIKLGEHEAALSTTGDPMLRRGTAHPLYIEAVRGNIDILDLAHDIYALSHLAFASPGSSMRLPFTIALADHILRESTPGQDEELWVEEGEHGDASFPLSSY